MLNDFTGGGQIFLHKLRMFWQVLSKSFMTALIVSMAIVGVISYKSSGKLDVKAAITYQKALFANSLDKAMSTIRKIVNPKVKYYITRIDAYDKKGLYAKDVNSHKIIDSRYFRTSYLAMLDFLKICLITAIGVMSVIFLVIYLIWSRFGRAAKEKKHLSGHIIKTPQEVARYLHKVKKASFFNIGNMPLVKDSESKHILITGSTGSGKTNCLHTLLPQIRRAKQSAIIVDTEGEMVSRYYRTDYDIIINPFGGVLRNV